MFRVYFVRCRDIYESAPALWYGCSRLTNRLCDFNAPTKVERKRKRIFNLLINTNWEMKSFGGRIIMEKKNVKVFDGCIIFFAMMTTKIFLI